MHPDVAEPILEHLLISASDLDKVVDLVKQLPQESRERFGKTVTKLYEEARQLQGEFGVAPKFHQERIEKVKKAFYENSKQVCMPGVKI